MQTEWHWGLDPVCWVSGDVVFLTVKGVWRSSCSTAESSAHRAVWSELGELGETVPERKGLLMNETMTK